MKLMKKMVVVVCLLSGAAAGLHQALLKEEGVSCKQWLGQQETFGTPVPSWCYSQGFLK